MRLYADGEPFVMNDEQFDQIQNMFVNDIVESEDDAVFYASINAEPWIKALPVSHVRAAFQEYAELTG